MLPRLALALVFALSVQSVSADARTTNVKVVNGRSAPALVMDQTVLRPVRLETSARLETGESFAPLELFTPPPGMMLVVEFLTIRAFVEDPTANALLEIVETPETGNDITLARLDAFPPPVELGISTRYQQTLTQQVLLYATDTIFLSIDRGEKTNGPAAFGRRRRRRLRLSGYLVPAPR
jgi:hypothetical protein